ncbi:DUF742 domain-containing protein [Nonomuraea africana]|uniref:DNA-binding MarR family transcriptional regulator n=1 Tax=Nonomuraea africana TaxID=46171 RepID=A0ABR9KSI5_9ACTN|nr:DUF742 domain-containing protein [Nonomuraea africana]MBE1564996.1 DNA-binding MarR family transcriptional regulator [Nonomuraea africana]
MTEDWLVRPYMMTRGRTRPTGEDFDLIAIVAATGVPSPTAGLTPEYLRVLAACRNPISVAEVASATGLSLGVVRVLLGDLRERQLVTVRHAAEDVGVLREVLHGLRSL